MSDDERTPLLQDQRADNSRSGPLGLLGDHHTEFCDLVGTRPHYLQADEDHQPQPHSLYYRAVSQRNRQSLTYTFTATLTNSLIMMQVVLGATLTALGASNSNHILVAIFGAANTIMAGMIAFLKSRGQPMRARMFRDDLERVVDEIENSATMWLGISRGLHGYDRIDTEDQVTVRSEVARLTRLYDKAVKTNTLNDPDMYSTGAPGDPYSAAMRNKTAAAASVPAPTPAATPAPVATAPADAAPAAAAPVPEPAEDASPASKVADPPAPGAASSAPKEAPPESSTSSSQEAPKTAETQPEAAKPTNATQAPPDSVAKPDEQVKKPVVVPPPSQPAHDPDESPASAARP